MRRLAPLAGLLVALVVAAPALAGAGGGSSGYGGGGGGGGGGFSGGGSSGGGSGGGSPWVGLIIILVVLAFLAIGAFSAWRLRRRRRERAARVTVASAEAAAEDPDFGAELVLGAARQLYRDCQVAWDGRDRARLAELVGTRPAGRVDAPAGRLRREGLAQPRRSHGRPGDRVPRPRQPR